MSATFWRRACFLLAALCAIQAWRGHGDGPPADAAGAQAAAHERSRAEDPSARIEPGAGVAERARTGRAADAPAPAGCPDSAGGSFYGFRAPPWAMALLPQPGENLLAYRDRLVPVARAAIAPQRARVTELRDDFAKAAHLDPSQRAVLDSAAAEAADAIETHVMTAAMSGDFTPQTFRPMQGVELARSVLDEIDRSDQKFRAALTDAQRATLAQQHFDFADYLVFTTPWEQALGYPEQAAVVKTLSRPLFQIAEGRFGYADLTWTRSIPLPDDADFPVLQLPTDQLRYATDRGYPITFAARKVDGRPLLFVQLESFEVATHAEAAWAVPSKYTPRGDDQLISHALEFDAGWDDATFECGFVCDAQFAVFWRAAYQRKRLGLTAPEAPSLYPIALTKRELGPLADILAAWAKLPA